jgi:pyruvate/2-oxoacid:ferredoxin oxidoreductase beta subunit
MRDLTPLPDLASDAGFTGPERARRPVYLDLLPPCNAGCPAGENIQAWLAATRDKDYERAWQLLTEDNPFPGICGRVCYHPCEDVCNRKELDTPVSIHAVERFLGDFGGNFAKPAEPTGKRVLIIGAGPSGLSAAYHLARRGHAVEVRDAGAEPGGMMRYGIPAYRLPRDVLATEIARIEALGVTITCGYTVKDLDAERRHFDAVFVAVGAHLSKHTEIPAREAARIIDAVPFLRDVSAGGAPVLGRRVAVYGGGNTAMDAARTARRLGASDALIVYRRTQGEPLFLDVVAALAGRRSMSHRPGSMPVDVTSTGGATIIGGRYGLSSKEFTPGMAAAVFAELAREHPKARFTVGINDDVSGTSLPWDELDIEDPRTTRAVFFGLGSDGTVGANKNTIKILGEAGLYAQGYFVYDSKKSGSETVSHLRFGPEPISAPYLISKASFVGIHQARLIERDEVLDRAASGATVLINAPAAPELPPRVIERIKEKKLTVYAVDADAIAREAGLGGRINTILQTCFFVISGILRQDEAVKAIKQAIEKTYGRRGPEIVQRNLRAVDAAVAGAAEIAVMDTKDAEPKYGGAPDLIRAMLEDNAEFGLGFRLAADQHAKLARTRLTELRDEVGPELADAILTAVQRTESDYSAERRRVDLLRDRLRSMSGPAVEDLRSVIDHLVRRSVWIVGGDGWAYDIGSGGLDHVLATGRDVNVLVLDTEVYSNTGGQASKATPIGAVARFAAAGKRVPKKDLALQAVAYRNVYVARIAMGADPRQTLQALREAESYEGPSLVIAYSHCIAHGIEKDGQPLRNGMDQQYKAVASGYWPLVRYDPVTEDFLLDSPRPRLPLSEYMNNELRFRILARTDPEAAERLAELAVADVQRRWHTYEEMAERSH